MENGEDFWLRYYNGSGWTTIDTYVSGTDFNNNSFSSATFTLNEAQYNLASNSQFRIQCDASGNNDYIFIDQVIITGIPSGPDVISPSVPLNLNASNTTQTTTNLSWDASSDNIGVIGYDVYQNGVFVTNVSVPTYQVTGLSASTSYSFYVIARDAAGNSSLASNTANITTLNPPDIESPTIPLGLSASNTTETTTDLSWDASTDNIGVTGYDVYQDGVFISSISATTYQVTGLSSNTTYAFYVIARDAAGNASTASNTANVTTDVFVDTEAPSTPTGLATSNTTDSSTDLSWNTSTDNIGVIGYDVYQNGVFVTNVLATTYQATGLSASTSYSFYVIARDAAGNSSLASNTANVTTLDPPDTESPTIPLGLSASNTTETATSLSWDASTDNIGVTGYDVYQDDIFVSNVSATAYQVTGLSSNTTYAFYVIARDAAGNTSTASNTANVTTDVFVDTEAPSTPTGLAASNTTETTTDLSWNSSTDNIGVTGYDVYLDSVFIINVSGTSYQVSGLSASTTYSFYVIARDAAGNSSSASNTINETTLATPTCNDGIQNGDETGIDCGGTCQPCEPSDVILNQGYFESGWDNWIDGGKDCIRYSGTNSYEGIYSIQLRDNSGEKSSMTLSNVDVTPFNQIEIDFYFYVSSMQNGEDFWLRYFDGSNWTTVDSWISGVNINNNNFYNATVLLNSSQYNFVSNAGFRFQIDASNRTDNIYIDQVTITGKNGVAARKQVDRLVVVGTLNEDSDNGIKIYPNPVKGDVLMVELIEGETFTYKIFKITGQIVMRGTSKGRINVAKLDSGMYFIEINNDNEVLTKKFIKQ